MIKDCLNISEADRFTGFGFGICTKAMNNGKVTHLS